MIVAAQRPSKKTAGKLKRGSSSESEGDGGVATVVVCGYCGNYIVDNGCNAHSAFASWPKNPRAAFTSSTLALTSITRLLVASAQLWSDHLLHCLGVLTVCSQ
jgi:hypothetical protein